jgi:hypothetical protein
LLTIVADRHRAAGGGRRVEAAVERGAAPQPYARVAGRDADEWVVPQGAYPHAGPGIETDAALAVVRVSNGRPVETWQIGGTHVRVAPSGGSEPKDGRRAPLSCGMAQ